MGALLFAGTIAHRLISGGTWSHSLEVATGSAVGWGLSVIVLRWIARRRERRAVAAVVDSRARHRRDASPT